MEKLFGKFRCGGSWFVLARPGTVDLGLALRGQVCLLEAWQGLEKLLGGALRVKVRFGSVWLGSVRRSVASRVLVWFGIEIQ